MRRIVFLGCLLISALAFADFAFARRAHSQHFVARLTQAEEVPPTGSATTGIVRLNVNYASGGIATSIDFSASITNGVQLRQLHAHCAPFGTNGPVVAFFAGRHDGGVNVLKGLWVKGNLTDSAISSTGTGITNPVTCALATDPPGGPFTGAVISTIDDFVQQILTGNAYICVHDAANPGGATRGQVTKYLDNE
jgi:hypothetical protein